jgi:hypothetical protein
MLVDERLETMGGKRDGVAPHNVLMPNALARDLGLAETATMVGDLFSARYFNNIMLTLQSRW